MQEVDWDTEGEAIYEVKKTLAYYNSSGQYRGSIPVGSKLKLNALGSTGGASGGWRMWFDMKKIGNGSFESIDEISNTGAFVELGYQ